MSDRARGWVETLWPILGGIVLVAIAYANLGAAASKAQDTADRAEKKADGVQDVRERLAVIETLIRNRLPAMGD